MLAHQQPADVGEEEAPFGVVGVRVGLGELVVDAVVPGPLEYVVLITGEMGGGGGGEGSRWGRLTWGGGSQSTHTHTVAPHF